jgi:hypothetical protein
MTLDVRAVSHLIRWEAIMAVKMLSPVSVKSFASY